MVTKKESETKMLLEEMRTLVTTMKKESDQKYKVLQELINLNNLKIDNSSERINEHVATLNTNIMRFKAELSNEEQRLKKKLDGLSKTVQDIERKNNTTSQMEYLKKRDEE